MSNYYNAFLLNSGGSRKDAVVLMWKNQQEKINDHHVGWKMMENNSKRLTLTEHFYKLNNKQQKSTNQIQ